MLEVSARLLRLLSLLQTRRDWTGPELAERLGVSARTVRYDIGKLRAPRLPGARGPGTAGGYRLGAGAAPPPLLLDDEEAVAVAVSLRRRRTAPSRASRRPACGRSPSWSRSCRPGRRRVGALHGYTTPLAAAGPTVAAGTLAAIAAACRDHRRLRFGYRRHDGSGTDRDVEPYRLVHTGRRWYLVGWDTVRDDWRTFRVDRLALRVPEGRGSPRARRRPRTSCRAAWTPRSHATGPASPSARPRRRSRRGCRRPCSSSRWTRAPAWSTR